MMVDFKVCDVKSLRKYEGDCYFILLSLLFLSSKVFVFKSILKKKNKKNVTVP